MAAESTASAAIDPVLLDILARACTPLERVESAWLRCVDQYRANQRFATWLTLVADGNPERGAQLLRSRGVSVEQWIQGLGTVEAVDDRDLPDWARTAGDLYQWLSESGTPHPAATPSLGEVAGSGLPAWIDPAQPWRFYPGFRAWMARAQDLVNHGLSTSAAPLAPSAAHDLVIALVRRLLTLAGPRLMEAAEQRKARDPLFSADPVGDWLGLWAEYPVLVRVMAIAWQQWRDTTAELLERIGSDLPTLEPGARVTLLQTGQGDLHAGGRGVVVIATDRGSRWYLKPRTSGAHRAIAHLFVQLDAAGEPLGLRLPDTDERSGYCWVRHLEREPSANPDEVREFFFRAGALLRIMQAVGATDLHHENFIPVRNQPILIDLETVFGLGGMGWSDAAALTANTADATIAEQLSDAPSATSMVTSPVDGPPGTTSVDIGALAGPSDRRTPYTVQELVLTNEGPRLHMSRVPFANGASLPILGDAVTPVDEYTSAVIAGYEDVQRRLCGRPDFGLAEAAQDIRIRFVARPTQIYVRLLQQSLTPAALRDGVDREFVLERLWLAADTCPAALIAAEQQALRELDVPLFTIGMSSTDLLTDQGITIPKACAQSPLVTAQSRLAAAVKRTDHTDDLRAALFAVAPQSGETPTDKTPLHETPIQTLLRRAIPLPHGGLAWVGLEYDPSRFRWRYQRLGTGLLGAAGIGLALVVAANASGHLPELAVLGKATLLDCARRVAQTHSKWAGVDAFTGPAGTLYALAKAAQASADEELSEAADGLVPMVLSTANAPGSGSSLGSLDGAVLAFLQLPHSSTQRTAVLERLAEQLTRTNPPTGDCLADRWAAALPSAEAGLAMACCRLGALPGFSALRDLPAANPRWDSEEAWRPGDAAAQVMAGLPLSRAEWEQSWWPHAHTAHRILDCADLARTAWLATAEPAWRDCYQRAVHVLHDAHHRSGEWFGDVMAPDSRNFSAVHGMAAIMLLALDGAAASVNLRVLG